MGHPKTYLLRLNCCTPPCSPSHFQCHYLGHQQQQVGRGKGESGHVKEDVGEWEFRPGHSCHSRLYREGTTCQQSEGRGAENSTSSYPQPQYKSHLHNCRLGEWGRFLHNICSLATPLPFYFQQAPHMNLEKSNDLLKHICTTNAFQTGKVIGTGSVAQKLILMEMWPLSMLLICCRSRKIRTCTYHE